MKIIAQIPARLGSERVKQKNLKPLLGKPMLSYAIEAAKGAKTLTQFYVNSESPEIGTLATELGADFYQRPAHLSTNEATQDQFNYDFISKFNSDYMVLINPVCPLIQSSDIDQVVEFSISKSFDTVITTNELHLHALMENKPLNFQMDSPLARTQDITPIQICNWSVCVWKTQAFKDAFEKSGFACFVGNVGYYPIPQFKSVKVSTQEDFNMAENLLKARSLNSV